LKLDFRLFQLTALLLLCLPVLASGQVLTKYGDPVMSVTGPAKATPTGKNKGKTPPLAAGQQVRLVETKDGMASVSTNNPNSSGMFNDYSYRLPMTALHYLPGKTHMDRPAWLPAPAPAGAEARDVVAYGNGKNNDVAVLSGRAKPRRVVQAKSWAMSPDGAFLVYSPEKGTGNVFLPLDGKTKPWRAGEDKKPTDKQMFSPDGSKLAWRAGRDIMILDLHDPTAKPRTLARGLEPGAELQGFAGNSGEVVLADSKSVSWLDLDGKKLRSLPLDTFTNEGAALGSAQYIPSPNDAHLMLIACDTIGTDAFHEWAYDMSGALYIYDEASGTNYRLTPKNIAAVSPAWSPDGKRVYFSALPDTPSNGPHHLYRMNADGTGLTDLGQGFVSSVGTRPE